MLDISSELLILPFNGGIKLMRPDCMQNFSNLHAPCSVAELLKYQFNVYFLDQQSSLIALNESEANVTGFDSIRSAKGKSAFDILKYNSATLIRENDLSILNTGIAKIIDEDLARTDEFNFQCLSFKFPIYNDLNTINGILGCSIILGQHSLTQFFSQMGQLGLFDFQLLPNNHLNSFINEPSLTLRQQECLVNLAKGMTMKQIGKALNLSPRTVENYIVILKKKLNCNSRIDLIKKAMQLDLSCNVRNISAYP